MPVLSSTSGSRTTDLVRRHFAVMGRALSLQMMEG